LTRTRVKGYQLLEFRVFPVAPLNQESPGSEPRRGNWSPRMRRPSYVISSFGLSRGGGATPSVNDAEPLFFLRRGVLFEALKAGFRLGNNAKGLYQQQVEHHGANQDERTEGGMTELP